jgi:hypothetical protein
MAQYLFSGLGYPNMPEPFIEFSKD